MIEIEERAVATFQKNFAYFSAQHPALFQKIRILQSAIETGQYRENYALEYLNGYFDVKELASGNFLYDSSSLEHAAKAAESVNLKKNESVIETLYNFPYTKANIEDLDKLTVINSHLVGTAPIVQLVNEHTAGLQEMKKIYKFIFFGVGVGEHLKAVHDKIHADSYLIAEENLELFRLSMFVTDYEALGEQSKLFFSVMDSPGDFKTTYNRFAEEMLLHNSHLKFYLFSSHYALKIKLIQNFAVTQSHLMYPYSYLLHKNLRVSRAIQGHHRFLNVLKPFENSPFTDKPMLYLAAGPSLNRHIEWVKTHRNRFVIVAVFMISTKLETAGIVPDIVVHVDEAKAPVRKTIDKLRDKGFLKESLFILAASTPLDLFETVADKERIFLLEDRTRYKKDHGFIEFFSVGEVGYALSLIFGTPALYLLGLDLAVDQTTGKTHADGHATEDAVDLSKAGAAPELSGSLRGTVLSVKGNRGAPVATTPLFDASIHRVNDYTRSYKKTDQQVFNLGDGAYFDETQPLDIETVDTTAHPSLDKSTLLAELYAYLSGHASDRLSDEELNNILVRKKELKKKAKLIERFARENLRDLEAFGKSFIKLAGELIVPVNPHLIETAEIFVNYIQNVGGYIGNLLNTEGLKHGDHIAKAMQKVLSRQLYKILHAFGQFEFGYLDGDKYFNANGFCALQDEVLSIPLSAADYPQIGSWYFLKALRQTKVDASKLEKAQTPGAIGFLGTLSNFNNAPLMDYLTELAAAHPHVSVNIFFFSGQEQAVLSQHIPSTLQRAKPVIVHTIDDICEAIEVFVTTGQPDMFKTIPETIATYCPEILVVTHGTKHLHCSIGDFAPTQREEDALLKHYDHFGFTEEEFNAAGGNAFKLQYCTILKRLAIAPMPDDATNVYRFAYFDAVDLALRYPEFKHYMYRLKKVRRELRLQGK